MLSSIQPIVLVGGRSVRFGRDKLREPLGRDGAEWMVDRPIAVLREVFGPRVALVGDCDPSVATRADLVLADPYPGMGPAGGILAALEQTLGDVFVLAGDLPHITAASVQAILDAARAPQDGSRAWVVLADADGIQPCIGLYSRAVLPFLVARVHARRLSLHDLAPAERLQRVVVDAASVRNVNTLDMLEP